LLGRGFSKRAIKKEKEGILFEHLETVILRGQKKRKKRNRRAVSIVWGLNGRSHLLFLIIIRKRHEEGILFHAKGFYLLWGLF